MNIEFVELQNFRRLKSCKIELSKKETVLVGPNNSGKTTAMDALILFLKRKDKFTTQDFTLSNWADINGIGSNWLSLVGGEKPDLSIDQWEQFLPKLDVWLNVNMNEIHYVRHLIPTLDWDGGAIGVRLRYEPKNIEDLFEEFTLLMENSKKLNKQYKGTKTKTVENKEGKQNFEYGPKDLWYFLDKNNKISSFFTVRAYILNPELKDKSQKLPNNSIEIETDPFAGLIKIDIINAQRGFSGANAEESESNSNSKILSNQLRSYYDKHLNPTIDPSLGDIKALEAIHNAKQIFDENLKDSFGPSLNELEILNYPGFGNPKITLSSNFNTVDSIKHDSSVQYSLEDGIPGLSLPEKYNGLGYQNLISIIFRLIRFRDDWMRVGKSNAMGNQASEFEPLHLVLIEEPEAHLHAQVQQVFINKAYEVLRKNENLKGDTFSTQLVISTHSNHIAHEIDFTSLRYFKRQIEPKGILNTSKVINLSTTFGLEDDTTRFATRYLRTTHCDLFFADAVILVEGPVERMLVPYFIRKYKNSKGSNPLSKSYISILEIGGSHAHRLERLINKLGVVTLIITDLDSIQTDKSKIRPQRNKGYTTSNDTLIKWLPKIKDIDSLMSLSKKQKESSDLPIRVAYQIPIAIKSDSGDKNENVCPYTFEDSLVLENKKLFAGLDKPTGLLKKMQVAAEEKNIDKSASLMYEAITNKNAKKAQFALDLLYLKEPSELETPEYIQEGLIWIDSKISGDNNSNSIQL